MQSASGSEWSTWFPASCLSTERLRGFRTPPLSTYSSSVTAYGMGKPWVRAESGWLASLSIASSTGQAPLAASGSNDERPQLHQRGEAAFTVCDTGTCRGSRSFLMAARQLLLPGAPRPTSRTTAPAG